MSIPNKVAIRFQILCYFAKGREKADAIFRTIHYGGHGFSQAVRDACEEAWEEISKDEELQEHRKKSNRNPFA